MLQQFCRRQKLPAKAGQKQEENLAIFIAGSSLVGSESFARSRSCSSRPLMSRVACRSCPVISRIVGPPLGVKWWVVTGETEGVGCFTLTTLLNSH
ncbi:hypothetical protein GPALN_014282 [Globodera pallida]|nr:hypothetical protein GPALN_014282 [Globodera pallida]